VRHYLEQQGVHHGYEPRIRPPIHRYRAPAKVELYSAHASFDLTHHLVFSTAYRKTIFDSSVGAELTAFWLKVAAKRGFAIDQVSVVPDHVHMIVRVVPKMSIEECALMLLNNGQHFVGQNYRHYLIEAGVNQLWAASAYAGTCGDFTTAAVKSLLG
jgi:putative transposase